MKVVWFCADRVGREMAGPGIRAVELSRRLARHQAVTLVAPGATSLSAGEEGGLALAEPEGLAGALHGAEVLVAQGFGFPLRRALGFAGRLVLDLYDPVQLEQLAQFGPGADAGRADLPRARASPAAGPHQPRRPRPLCVAAPARLVARLAGRRGPARARRAGRRSGRGAAGGGGALRAGRGADPRSEAGRSGPGWACPTGAPLALFWGGLWDWMDPALAVRAVSELRRRGSALHLVLLAGARPGGDTMRSAADEARRAVAALGLAERVHLLDRWIPYAERGAVLADADLAVTAHRPSLEAELAFRTRLLDCLWAWLPPACTRGDTLAEEAEREGWGRGAEAGDPESLAAAMAALAEPGARAQAVAAMEAARERYSWRRSGEALLALLEAPAPARPRMLVPGEVAGAHPASLARALGRKLLGRVRRR